MLLIIFGDFFMKNEVFEAFVFGDTANIIQLFFGVFLIMYWVYLIVLWAKYDMHIGRFFAMFFLAGLYSIYYSYWLLKNIPSNKISNPI